MIYNNQSLIKRKKSKLIYVGKVPIGNGHPISVQSMTNTLTTDITATVTQIKALKHAGADIIRISIPDIESAESLKKIKKKIGEIPLIADIHFDYRIALKVLKQGIDCLRINPGNIGNKNRIKQVVECAKYYNTPIRIGINAGSLEREINKKYQKITPNALLESAMRNIDYFEKLNFDQFKVSIKASDIFLAIESYRLLSKEIEQPLHIGITESGSARLGSIKSAIGLGTLLLEGIGDTLRVSLAADPVEEVKVGFDILKALKIRSRGINFIVCPSCARQEFNVIDVISRLEKKLSDIVTPMNVSIIGCIVNGKGEALTVDIGITGGKKNSDIYEDGIRLKQRLDNKIIVEQLEKIIREKSKKIENKYKK